MEFKKPTQGVSYLSKLVESVEASPPLEKEWKELAPEEINLGTHNYKITATLGKGGMAAVYKATQLGLNREVAIKILPPGYKDHIDFGERFIQEAQILAKLSHPNILYVYDFGETDQNEYYYVMEYIEGHTLQDYLPLIKSREEMTECVVQLTNAVQYLHDNDIIHRDIKPSNILLSDDGQLKVADLGLAKNVELDSAEMTLTGLVMGTYDYMAPEQRKGITNKTSDIYSIGVVIYEMLVKALPEGRFAMPSEINPQYATFDALIDTILQQNPEKRYQQANEVGQAWQKCLEENKPKNPVEPPPSWPYQKLALYVSFLLIIILLIIIFSRCS